MSEEQVLGNACSPDGKWLLARDLKKDEWRLLSLGGGEPRIAPLPAAPSKTALVKFTADGGAIYFMGRDPATRNLVYRVDLATGHSELWHTFSPVGLSGGRPIRFALSDDGVSFAYNETDETGHLYLTDRVTGR